MKKVIARRSDSTEVGTKNECSHFQDGAMTHSHCRTLNGTQA